VSEADLPVESSVEPQREAVTEALMQPRSGGALALLAMLLALLALGATGWSFWQQQQLAASSTLQAQLDQLRVELSERDATTKTLHSRFADYAQASEVAGQQQLLAQLQGNQQALEQRVSRVLGGTRQGWRLAEAEHLLRLASLRLAALQDINSALVLVEGASEILREQDDPDAFATRQQIASLLQALRGVDQPDRSGLFLQLGALREQTPNLQPLTPVFAKQAGVNIDSAAEGDGSSRLAQWREQLSQYFRIQLHAGQDVRPLLAGVQLDQVRLALNLSLEQAQWAALNAEAKVYLMALGQAQTILQGAFQQDNSQSRAMLASLEQLATQPVSVSVPDMQPALGALQAYIVRRQQIEEQPVAPAAGKQP
jgi:uroporphyrin-3 C-methyltransferase